MSEIQDTLNIVSTFINKLKRLSDDKIQKLNDGTAKFEYVEINPKPKKAQIDFSEQCKVISDCNSREEAYDYIKSLKLKKDGLLALAKAFDINTGAKDTKAVIEDKIVESVVGFKLRTQAIMSGD